MITSTVLALLIAADSSQLEVDTKPTTSEPTTLDRLQVSASTLLALSLTPGRTQGGIGGGIGVSYELTRSWLVSGEAAWLVGIGSSTLLRFGGGWQRAGTTWRPMVRLNLELGLGDSLDFSVAGRLPPLAPTFGLTATVSLLRFHAGFVDFSFLEVTGGLSTEWVRVGPRFGVDLFTLSVPLSRLL